MHKFLFYNKFILCLYMFRALCAHHQEVKLCYTASGIITPVGRHSVHTGVLTEPVHGTATYTRRCDDTRYCITQFDLLMMST